MEVQLEAEPTGVPPIISRPAFARRCGARMGVSRRGKLLIPSPGYFSHEVDMLTWLDI